MSAIIVRMDHVRAGRALAQRASDLQGIARRLIAARKAKRLRPIDLASVSGLGRNTIANWEMGSKRPRIDQLALVLPTLGVSADWVYFGDDTALTWQVRDAIMAELAQLPERLPAADARKRA